MSTLRFSLALAALAGVLSPVGAHAQTTPADPGKEGVTRPAPEGREGVTRPAPGHAHEEEAAPGGRSAAPS
jgi:hypothetical protein